MYHANLNVNLIVENVTQIKIWIIIVNVSASIKVKKKTVYAKKIMLGLLVQVVVKKANM